MSHPPRIGARHCLPAVAVLAAALLCGGCAGHGQGSGPAHGAADHETDPAASPAPGHPQGHAAAGRESGGRTVTVQEIAAAVGCTAEITVDAEELREGACGTGKDAYRMLTFTAEEGRRAWLAEARNYGGSYLVGDRWIVTAASAEALAPLRDRLGGTVESGDSHTGGHGGGHAGGHGGGHSPGP
ncbi:hypothetical protein [Streptomyces sp. NPDC090022]|uniref:hypothetical protein n=1 Tax=Streptomyces sp. NPDC090022 TaxID=3365920 RepID=UPI00382926AC